MRNTAIALACLLAAACSKPPAPSTIPAPHAEASPAAAAATAVAPIAEAAAPAAGTATPSAAAVALPASGVVTTADVAGWLGNPQAPLLLDVRTPEEFAEGHVPGALNIPVDDLPGRLGEIEAARERGVVTYCKSGGRATKALETLKGAGFTNVAQMDGSMSRWSEEGRTAEKPQ